MRNTWLIIRREYLERIRSKAFLIFTIITPLFVAGVTILPSKLMTMKPAGTRQVVIVSQDKSLAESVQNELASRAKATGGDDDIAARYTATINTEPTDQTKEQLNAQIAAGKLDGYVWLNADTPQTRKFTYYTKNAADFMESESMRSAVRLALMKGDLSVAGVSPDTAEQLMKPVSVETLRVDKGKVRKTGGMGAFMLPILLMMMIYMTMLIYGMNVMRSVIEEKSSRVMEVMLSSVTAKELMAGKVFGVGAVGLTQMVIWAVLGLLAGSPGLIAARPYLKDASVPMATIVFFPVFFVIGYLLYSALFAAVGAMVNSDEEAQQLQWPVTLPLIACVIFAFSVLRQPSSPIAFWLSMFPLTSPIIMFVRISVEMPPVWQIVLSLAILLATIYGVLVLCSRIYRVGILMYGKRPTLPEIVKWIKYA